MPKVNKNVAHEKINPFCHFLRASFYSVKVCKQNAFSHAAARLPMENRQERAERSSIPNPVPFSLHFRGKVL